MTFIRESSSMTSPKGGAESPCILLRSHIKRVASQLPKEDSMYQNGELQSQEWKQFPVAVFTYDQSACLANQEEGNCDTHGVVTATAVDHVGQLIGK